MSATEMNGYYVAKLQLSQLFSPLSEKWRQRWGWTVMGVDDGRGGRGWAMDGVGVDGDGGGRRSGWTEVGRVYVVGFITVVCDGC